MYHLSSPLSVAGWLGPSLLKDMIISVLAKSTGQAPELQCGGTIMIQFMQKDT